jgi:hypothetical protein
MNEETPDIERRLELERPVPRPLFRGELRRSLMSAARTRPEPPRRLRLAIAGYAASGALLLAIAAVGLAGAGPLSP